MERRADFYLLYYSANLYYQFSLKLCEQCADNQNAYKMNGKLSSNYFFEVWNLSQGLITLGNKKFLHFFQF